MADHVNAPLIFRDLARLPDSKPKHLSGILPPFPLKIHFTTPIKIKYIRLSQHVCLPQKIFGNCYELIDFFSLMTLENCTFYFVESFLIFVPSISVSLVRIPSILKLL